MTNTLPQTRRIKWDSWGLEILLCDGTQLPSAQAILSNVLGMNLRWQPANQEGDRWTCQTPSLRGEPPVRGLMKIGEKTSRKALEALTVLHVKVSMASGREPPYITPVMMEAQTWWASLGAACGTLAEQVIAGHVLPFVGAGISMGCTSTDAFGATHRFPGWGSFLASSADEGARSHVWGLIEEGKFEFAAEFVESRIGSLLGDIHTTFGRPIEQIILSDAAQLLARVFPNSSVITTNYDEVLEKAFGEGLQPIFGFSVLGLEQAKRQRKLFKIHGHHDGQGLVLLPDQYDAAYGFPGKDDITMEDVVLDRGDFARALSTVFQNHSLLFLGCSLRQDRTALVLQKLYETYPLPHRHFGVVAWDLEDLEHRQRLRRMGIHPIFYPPGHHHLIDVLLEELLEVFRRAHDPS